MRTLRVLQYSEKELHKLKSYATQCVPPEMLSHKKVAQPVVWHKIILIGWNFMQWLRRKELDGEAKGRCGRMMLNRI